MDWTELTDDPCDGEIQRDIFQHLKSKRKVIKDDYMEWLLEQVGGRACLDIGSIHHNLSHVENSAWKFSEIDRVAQKAVGLDILQEPVEMMQSRGFDLRVCDATSDRFLGEKFEVVIAGDVLEHVSNPVKLIEFSNRHLKEDGFTIVKTPNPYYIDNIKRFLLNDFRRVPNFEHVAWFTPTMALELARRAGCTLESYLVFPRKRVLSSVLPSLDIWTKFYVFKFAN